MVLKLLRPNKKLGWVSFVVLGVLALTAVLVTTPSAFAMWDTVADIASRFCLMIATLFLKLTIFVLTFIIQIAAYNGYLDSTAVNYGWVMVRDITNMGFVVILLLIAFGTILGLEQYEWKKMMVKFVLAAILVNFSRVICGVMIDVAQVIMVTFINGVAATAGGNLIQMFNMDQIMKLTSDSKSINPSEILMASVAGVFFAGLMLGVMCVFLIMLAARMLTLWVLIVLSPLAFVLSVIPQTQKYASEWWQNFGNNVISGPVIAFFLWLSFVTVGGGTINSEIESHSQIPKESRVSAPSEADKVNNKTTDTTGKDQGGSAAGISSAMSWDKMASFVIAIGMLLVGAKTAQQLGVTGGSMMSKATDFAKKAAMVATGVAAGKWAYDKGVKPAAKWAAMNAPLVGGNAWIRKGKTIAGYAGGKWQKFQQMRTRGAINLEEENKKVRDAKFKAKRFGEHTLTDAEKDTLKNSRTAKSRASRFIKGLGVAFVEPQGRGMKRADDWLDHAKTEAEITGRNYSTSSSASGQAKLESDTDLEGVKKKGAGNKQKKVENLTRMKQEKELADRAAIQFEIKIAQESGDEKGEKAARAKLKDFGSKAIFWNAEKAELAGKIAAEQNKGSTVQTKRGVMAEESAGVKLAAAEARAQMSERGLAAEMETERYAQEMAMINKAKADLEADPKNAGARAIVEANQRAMELMQASGEAEASDDLKANLEAARSELEKAKTDFETTRDAARPNNLDDAKVVQDAQQALSEAQAKVEAAEEAIEAEKASKVAAPFDPAKMTELLEKLITANKIEDEGLRGAEIGKIKGGAGDMDMFRAMFGQQKVEDIVNTKRNLEALNSIKKAIDAEKATLSKSGTTIQDARKVLGSSADTTAADSRRKIQTAWMEKAKTDPSAYVARSEALRDHKYNFYTGKKQEFKDAATQSEIWDQMGIETPSGAAQESVFNGLHAKNFKDMGYNQIIAALNAHQNHVTAKGGVATEEDKLIGMAIMKQLIDNNWVDDAIPAYSSGLGISRDDVAKMRAKKMQNSGVNLNRGDISTISGGLGGINLKADIVAGIRNRQRQVVDQFRKDFKTAFDNAKPSDFGGKSMDEIIHILQNASQDQYDDLIKGLVK